VVTLPTDAVRIREVGPRDGLQNEDVILSPGERADLIMRLAATGVPVIEAVSFVNPRRVPQMAGAEEVLAELGPLDGTVVSGLVLNRKGVERALATPGINEIQFALAATEQFSLANAGMSVAAALEHGREVLALCRDAGVPCYAGVAVAFGCPYEGPVDARRVLEIMSTLAEYGADELTLADTVGYAVPAGVRELVSEVRAIGRPVGVHLHNTRNMGIANAYAAIEAGAGTIDASVGGIGGCPFAPRATGNIATEELVFMLGPDGTQTGVDLERLIDVARWLEQRLARPLESRLYKVGTPWPRALT
jgi:isopropylmalate/homocitrate/citramalate synthase